MNGIRRTLKTVRLIGRWLCIAVLLSIFAISVAAQIMKFGWEFVAFMAVLVGAIAGAVML